VKGSQYLGALWPPAIMPVDAESVGAMLAIAENQQWLLKHADTYDRRAWWFLLLSALLVPLTNAAVALVIPAVYVRIQVSRMLRYARNQQKG
jgi:hypothetical protein